VINLLELKAPPQNPGVYQFKDKDGQIIYIGKAKSLRSRVKTYFGVLPKGDFKTQNLVQNISDVEYILTDNELEALILESVLIKKHKPKYNIRLRDDKNYQFIKIDYSAPIAKIYSVRNKDERLAREKAKYFGPFTSGLNVRNTLRLIKRIFPYCQAEKVSTRPCFNYQLHRCPGVCIGIISPEEYRDVLSDVELLLQGHNREIKKKVMKQMKEASKRKQFERAASLRDQLEAVESLNEQQKVISIKNSNQDLISIYRQKNKAAVNLFLVRSGRLLAKENMLLENVENKTDSEIITAFLERYYLDATNLPREIFLEHAVEDEKLFTQFLQKKFFEITSKKLKIKITVPKRGTSKKLIELGRENARNFLEQQFAKFKRDETLIDKGLAQLKSILNLPDLPERIECFDISNISGTNAVGSMVVFTGGRPNKDHYRKFKIRTKKTPDDYAMMTEVLNRRLRNDWPKPDLWVIDGGKGQLNAAIAVLKKRKSDIPCIALGKSRTEAKEIREEKIYLPGRAEGMVLGEGAPALTIIQRLRDEAHRFAITYHRNLRSKNLFKFSK